MKEMDFSELDAVNGGIKLGGLANNAVATTPTIDPFAQQYGQQFGAYPLGGVPFDPFQLNGAQLVPYNYGGNNGGCHPCNPCGDNGDLFFNNGFNGLNGGQLGVNPYASPLGGFLGGVPGLANQGGLVTAGSTPIVDPNLAGQLGALGFNGATPFGGLVGGVPQGAFTIGINGVPVPVGNTIGAPIGGTLGSPIGAPVSPALQSNASPLGFVF